MKKLLFGIIFTLTVFINIPLDNVSAQITEREPSADGGSIEREGGRDGGSVEREGGKDGGEVPADPVRLVTIENPLKAKSITALFTDLIEVVLVFATPLIVFFIIYAGFLYVTARGNPEQIQKATRALLYAVIGGLLILGAFIILQVIQGTVDALTI